MEYIDKKSEVKIAHIILVHQFPNQLRRLVLSLTHPQVHFFIHVDKKVGEDEFREQLKDIANVTFVKTRINVIWAGFSYSRAILSCMKEVVDHGGYSHLNLLSGSDYPLTPSQEFIAFIQESPNKEFFEFYPIETEWKEAIPRYANYRLVELKFRGNYSLEKVVNFILPRRKMPYNMTPVGRLVWFTITIELAKYFVETFNQRKYLHRFFRWTWGTDEIIFCTLAYNSDFKDSMVNNSLRYVYFPHGEAHPKILTIYDLNDLYLKKHFFARKFHPIESKSLLNELDKRLNE